MELTPHGVPNFFHLSPPKVYKDMKSFYQEVVDRGLEFSSRYSDLYVKQCKELDEILKNYPQFKRGLRVVFRSNVDGEIWNEFPFLYEPYWVERGVLCM